MCLQMRVGSANPDRSALLQYTAPAASSRRGRMTTIGPSAIFTGELTTTEDLIVEGRIEGYLHVRDATVTVGQSASIKADIRATRVFVLGHVEGAIVASERIELSPTATG